MILTKAETLFASLVGTKVAESMPRFQAVQDYTMKRELPKIPFLPVREQKSEIVKSNAEFDEAVSLWKSDFPNIEGQFFPLSFKRIGTQDPFYTLPYEPLITISGSNEIVKRKPAKAHGFIGTIKERWSQNDYEITITGSIFGEDMIGKPEDAFPREDFEKLRDYMTHPQGLEVLCEPLQLLGINAIVVEDFIFPFTKGENVQAYEISALSDFSAEFLLEIED